MTRLTLLICLFGLAVVLSTSYDVTRRTETGIAQIKKTRDKLELELEELQAERGSLTPLFRTQMGSSSASVSLSGDKNTPQLSVFSPSLHQDFKSTMGEKLFVQPTKQSQTTTTSAGSPLSLLLGILQVLDRTKKQDLGALHFIKTQHPEQEQHRLDRVLYTDAALEAVWDPLILENEADVNYVTPAPSRHNGNNKQWPQFLYQRVTESPQDIISLSHHGHHPNAYIAVSAVTPQKLRSNKNQLLATTPASYHEQLPHVMDTLVTKIPRPPLHRVTSMGHVTHEGMKLSENVASEEQEIEDLVQSSWNHEGHQHKLMDQQRVVESLKKRWHILSHDT